MTTTQICEQVRWCIDEEATNDTNLSGASSGDCTYMDNIIVNKIPAALRWVCLYAPADQLSGGSS